eukprot:gene36608-44410_t
MQKVRMIERSTKGKVNNLYASLSNKLPLKSQNELKEDRIEVLNPSEIGPIIPSSTAVDVKDNKASEYLKKVETYQRHQNDQQLKIDKLLGGHRNKSPVGENRQLLSSTGDSKKMKRGTGTGRSRSPPTLPNNHLQPIPLSLKKSSESRPPSQSSSGYVSLTPLSPPSSAPRHSPPLSRNTLSYTPLPTTSTTATTTATSSSHKAFLQSFSLKVFTEMGIHLDPAYNKHSRYSRALSIFFVYWRQARLFSSVSQWKEYVAYCQKLQRELAAKRIFQALRYFQFISALRIRVQRRVNENNAATRRYIENQRFLNKMARIITACVFRVGKLKQVRKLVQKRRAATCIQRHIRGKIARIKYKYLRREMFRQRVCVLKIQRMYKRRLAVRKALLARKLQFVEDWLASLDARSQSFRTSFTQSGAQYVIASLYRKSRLLKKLHRLVYLHQHAMAIKIQKHLRGYWVRKQFRLSRQEKEEQLQREIVQIIIIQKYVRRYLAQMLLLRMIQEQDSARIVKYNEKLFLLAQGPKNAFFHRLWHKLKYRGIMVWMSKEKKYNACARNIQRLYRGFHGRQRAKVLRIKNQVDILNEELKLRRRSAIKIQKIFRGWKARIRGEARRRGEGIVTNRLHLIHMLSSIQMRILTDTLDIPLGGGRTAGGMSNYSVCGVPPPCGGVFQALFVACICPSPRMDAQSLSTNKVDNVTMNKFFTKLPLFLTLNPTPPPANPTPTSNPLVQLIQRPYLAKYGGLYAPALSQDKEKVYMMASSSVPPAKTGNTSQPAKIKPNTNVASTASNPVSATPPPLLLELLLGNLPFPSIAQPLTIIDMDVIFSQSKNAMNALKKLSFTEFLKALEYMGRLQYDKGA